MAKKVKDPNRIKFGEKASFFFCNMGNIPIMLLLSTFFLIFYTDVVGLDPKKLATLFLFSKIVDGISDPIMGYLLDRFPVSKMGKFRPMLILGTIVCSVNYILLWFGAVWAPVGKYFIVYLTYLLLGWTFDIMDISLNSMIPVMTAESKERNSLSLIKMVAYVLGGVLVSVLGPIIVADGSLGSYYTLIFGFTAVVLIGSIGGVLGVKERVAFKGDETEKYGLKELFPILTTKPVIITFAASLFLTLATFTQSSANAYYYTYILGDLSIMAGVSGIAIAGMLPALILSPIVANKIGKKKVYVIGLVIAALGFAVRFLDLKSVPLLYVSALLMNFGTGFTNTLIYGIQADNTTYVQYTTGKRAEAAIASLNSFITKVGQGVAGAIPGYILAATGFVAGQDVQSKAVNNGIIACVVTIPIIVTLISALIFGLGYKLDNKTVETMTEEIKAKSAAAGNA